MTISCLTMMPPSGAPSKRAFGEPSLSLERNDHA